MKLRELKSQIKKADEEKRVPSAKALRNAGVRIVVREVFPQDAELTVYANGYVLYRAGKRTAVFRLHQCGEYVYTSSSGEKNVLLEDFFENENWYVRLLIEAEELLVRNQIRVLSNNDVYLYDPINEPAAFGLADIRNLLEEIVEQETVQELLDCISPRQKEIIKLYFWEQLNQAEIAEMLGISQQSVSQLLKRAIRSMKEYTKKM